MPVLQVFCGPAAKTNVTYLVTRFPAKWVTIRHESNTCRIDDMTFLSPYFMGSLRRILRRLQVGFGVPPEQEATGSNPVGRSTVSPVIIAGCRAFFMPVLSFAQVAPPEATFVKVVFQARVAGHPSWATACGGLCNGKCLRPLRASPATSCPLRRRLPSRHRDTCRGPG